MGVFFQKIKSWFSFAEYFYPILLVLGGHIWTDVTDNVSKGSTVHSSLPKIIMCTLSTLITFQNFRCGTASAFKVWIPNPLGSLETVEIWHDNSGHNPHWFLDKVLVKETNEEQRWITIIRALSKYWFEYDFCQATPYQTMLKFISPYYWRNQNGCKWTN